MEINEEIPSVCRVCLQERAKVVIIPDPEKQRKHMKEMHDIDPSDFF